MADEDKPEEEKQVFTHGGRREGSGRKKGVLGPQKHEGFTITLSTEMWIFLTETAKSKGYSRSRYVDRLVAAVIRDGKAGEIDIDSMDGDTYGRYLRLTTGRRRSTYISMNIETWHALDEAMKKLGWRKRSRALEKILLSQMILPDSQRVRLESYPVREKSYKFS